MRPTLIRPVSYVFLVELYSLEMGGMAVQSRPDVAICAQTELLWRDSDMFVQLHSCGFAQPGPKARLPNCWSNRPIDAAAVVGVADSAAVLLRVV